MYFLIDSIVESNYGCNKGKPIFQSKEEFERNNGISDLINIDNKFRYGYHIYYDDDEAPYVYDMVGVCGNISRTALEKCVISTGNIILNPLIWLINSDYNLYAFTKDCEEYNETTVNDYKYIDIADIATYSYILCMNGDDGYLLSKYGSDVSILNYRSISTNVVFYDKNGYISYCNPKDIIYNNPEDIISAKHKKLASLQVIDRSITCLNIKISVTNFNSEQLSSNITSSYKPHLYCVLHKKNLYYVYYLKEFDKCVVSIGNNIYDIAISDSYIVSHDNFSIIKLGNISAITKKQFKDSTHYSYHYIITAIDYI